MSNFTSKKNFGLPVNTLCAGAFILGLAAAKDSGTWFYFLVIAGLAFAFDFDAKVKGSIKQAGFLAAAALLIDKVLGVVLSLFASIFEVDTLGTFYKLLAKIDSIFGLAVTVVFVLLAAYALLGKGINVKALDDLSSDSVKCPNCGTPASEGTPFCGKCGAKL